MKRGTIEHPKTHKLARILGLPIYAAAGLLESLWHYTARVAKRGDVGRWDDEEIAAGCFWDGTPTVLIEAFLAAGWLDRCPQHRLVVHDWHEHADEAVRKALQRGGKTFVAVEIPESEPQVEESPAVAARPESVATVSRQRQTLSRLPEARARSQISPPGPLTGGPLTAPLGNPTACVRCAPLTVGPLPRFAGEVSAQSVVEEFWKAIGEERKAQGSEIARAGELIERYGSDLVRELVPKVAAKIRAEKRPIRLLGGAMRDFELAAAQVSRRESEARRREQDAEERRRASQRGDEQKAEMQRMRDRNRKRWDGMTEAERGQIRAEIVAKWPILAGSPDLLLDACLLQLCQLEEPCPKTRSKPKGGSTRSPKLTSGSTSLASN